MRMTVATAVACLLGVGVSTAHDAQAAIKKETSIPAQGLGPALKQLANERDIQLVYRSEVVGERKTSGAVGELSFDEALTKLLKGTGLTYQYIDTKAITIVPMDARSAPQRSPADSVDTGMWERFRLAQAEAPTTKSSSPGTRNAERRVTLEEIVVTAQKREQRLLDVPVSITAVTAEDIERRGLVGAADYLRGMPGANQIEAAPSQSIVIRGIETQHIFQGDAGGQATGTYFGESPTSGSAGIVGSSVDIKLVDIERVEVLRGPQGTTFGSGSLGGVVRTIPVAPNLDTFEGKVAGGYSFTSGTGDDNYNVQAVANIPLVQQKLAVRAVAYQYEDSGFYRNRAGSNAAFQAAVAIPQGSQAFATDDENVGAYQVVGGRFAALWQATDDFKVTLSYLAQKTETDGIPLAMTAPYEQTVLGVAPEHVRRGQKLGLIDTDLDLASAVLEYDLGWADLLGTYSYMEGGSLYARPMTSVGVAHSRSQLNDAPRLERTGELRLATKFEGAWNFLVGTYAENIDDDLNLNIVWFGDLAASPYTPLGFGRVTGDAHNHTDQEQKAAFGEVSWKFLPGWTLTGGARYSEFQIDKRSSSLLPSGAIQRSTQPTLDESQTTGKASLSYQPNSDSLVYAGYAQGFRLGRPGQALPPDPLCDSDGDGFIDGTGVRRGQGVDSDTVDSYELGAKFALMDGRLRTDAAVFRMDWTGIPVFAVAPAPIAACRGTYLANAGEARSEGVELQANFQITDSVRVDFGGSWIEAQLTKDAPLQGWSEGDKLPGTPEVIGNLGLQYEFGIGSHKAFVRADSIYVGPFHSLIGQEQEAGDYVKLDATVRVELGQLNIDLYGRNLTNEDSYTYHSPIALPGLGQYFGYQLRPRTIGLQLGYDF